MMRTCETLNVPDLVKAREQVSLPNQKEGWLKTVRESDTFIVL